MSGKIELWGGVECTVNRVQENFFDQIKLSGHGDRLSDLEAFAALGIKTLRFPILWERIAPDSLDCCDWSLTDKLVSKAQDLGLNLIAGLLHHGSGPKYTNLCDPNFPNLLASFAEKVARRYPWIKAYTPVNEPLTTARFSGLSGFWYPHASDDTVFLRILLNECRGTEAAMQRVREVRQEETLLVQTEDLCKVFSTPFLSYQATFENHRRWLSYDMLSGRVDSDHPLWPYISKTAKLDSSEIDAVQNVDCAPDIMGVNHYITSNRFLDERLERYPAHLYGGNGRHRYVDIEAVRVGAETIAGPRELLGETWERYKTPIAITEVHMACSRDEQLRWLNEVWQSANSAKQEDSIDIRGVTVWSLLGAFDWDSLVTAERRHYESGVYDLRAPAPRPTALAAMIKGLATDGQFDHPVLESPGWWKRPHRLLYAPVPITTGFPDREIAANIPAANLRPAAPILVIGHPGTLASAFSIVCEHRGLAHQTLARHELDASDPVAVDRVLAEVKPWAVVNAVAFYRIDAAEIEREACLRDNLHIPRVLATACAKRGLQFLTFSSDLVFDGQKSVNPYVESDPVHPLNMYGRSKAEAEQDVMKLWASALIVRTGMFFGPWDEENFLTSSLRRMRRGEQIFAPEDLIVSPTYIPDLVNVALDLLIDDEAGVWHVANNGVTSWAEFAGLAASHYGLNRRGVVPVTGDRCGFTAHRPRFSALRSERGGLFLPTLEDAIARYVRDCRVAV